MNLQKNNIKRYILRRYSIDELESIFNQKLNNQSRNFKHYANMSSNKFMVIVVSSITEEILVQLTDGWVEDSPIPEEGLYKFIQEIFGERIIKKYDELTNMNLQENIHRIKQMMGIDNTRHTFDIQKLVDNNIIFVTKPGDGQGGIAEPNWDGDCSVITLDNLTDEEIELNPWRLKAIKHPLPNCIPFVQDGQSEWSDEKYHQVINSIKRAGGDIKDYIMNLQEQTNRIKQMMGIIKESSDEEAWELVGQDDKVIKSIVKQTGYKNDEESVERLIPIIDSLPTEEVDYTQIRTFHNLENKSGDKGLLSKMYQISKTDDPRKEYGEYMDKRDSGENRNRGYKPVKNYDRIVNDEYESPVVLKHNDKYYVIGGRTRLYASVAANKPIKIKILTKNDL